MRLNSNFIHHHFNLTSLKESFGEYTTSIVKQWIDTNYRIIRTKAKLQFLKHCKTNNVTPSHLSHLFRNKFNFSHYKSISKIGRLIKRVNINILSIEIFDLQRQLDGLNNRLSSITHFLPNILPIHICNGIYSYYLTSFRKCHHRLWIEHKEKFEWIMKCSNIQFVNKIKPIIVSYTSNINNNTMGLIHNKSVDTTAINSLDFSIDPFEFFNKINNNLQDTNNRWFINLSNETIPKEVSTLLQLGGKFSLPSTMNKKKAIHEFIKDVESNTKNHNIMNQISIRNTSIPLFHKFLHQNKPKDAIEIQLRNLHKKTSQFHKDNPDILFTRADKGNITVALKKDSYISNIEELLNDNNTYTTVNRNPSTKIEKTLNDMLKKWLQKDFISKKEFFFLRSSDSSLPKAYGLPKVHKEGNPFRLIVSSINTSLYSIAAYLQKILRESLPQPDSFVNNSFDLFINLSGKNLPGNMSLVSFDVTSLFTNVPINLAIEGIKNRWNHIQKNTKIPLDEFILAIEFVLSSTYFTFNDIIYKQTYGTPMGSPISPIIADIVMQDLETSILTRLNIQLPFYYRYVDDIVLAAPKDKIVDILDEFNGYHSRLKFTYELENNSSLSFLDLELRISDNKILIDWFHKRTFSGRTLSYHSNHPIQHKIGTIYSFVDRAILLSHPRFHKKNLEFIIDMLMDNGFPLDFIFKQINYRLRNIPKINLRTAETETSGTQRKKFMVLPYIHKISDSIKSIIDKNKFTMGFRCLNKLSNFIKVHKDRNKLECNCNVIYKIYCKDCDASYVGQTKRKLSTRLKEHRTNIKLDASKHSVVTDHILQNNHTFDWEKVRILDIESNFNRRIISEMINIKEQKNGINLNKDTDMLDESYFDLLGKLANLR